jgi:plasmid stability protein
MRSLDGNSRYDIMISNEEDAMAQLVVRNLEEEVKTRLRQRAAQNGRSMEEEVRNILREAVKGQEASVQPLGNRIAARFAGLGLETDLPERLDEPVRPATLE